MKRALIVAALVAASIIPSTSAHAQEAPCAKIRWKQPYYTSHDVRPVKRLIRCAVRRWPVPGGVSKALSVARCESSFRPDAVSPAPTNLGVYQHRATYWPARADRWLRPRWEISHRWNNARANVIVSVRIAHVGGSWASWACA